MPDAALLIHWAEFALRWLHVVTAIAWIGSSFYFIALDLGLRRAPDMPEGVKGEEWQVHGGGFYHIRKYMVAPPALPQHLTWFKWESYATWLSGFALLSLVYYGSADLFLIDPERADLPRWGAIALSAGSLAAGWLIYDGLCRSRLGSRDVGLMLALYVVLVAAAWGYAQVFSGRAAFLHLGALTATIMSANVFLVIIPNQKIVVADLRAGRAPDPEYGRIAKQRSTHNNYLTLPVVFMMLSNHYPLAFAAEWNWAIAALVFLMGVTIRHFFNTMHATGRRPWWTWGATAALFAAAVWLSTLGPGDERAAAEDAALSSEARRWAEAEGFAQAVEVVSARCSMCHAAEPGWEGIPVAPRGVVLETPEQIARWGRMIELQAGLTRAMPPANVSFMEPEERALIRAWARAAREG
ncbi:urate hydroxylase PuuD [Oceanicella actignis]|uniref:Uncharacterized membrane protein n=1 Tax=Oceanicella actignis TaxID=1189325 RepID=A0A1M7TKN2_9RHOB|nr:urate hydroxylase PuuD [Oceanicella actignis]SET68544.1 Uncharacterized membrane protein [Oceanicella actignis]SHN71280.1 Uncharacterized membrane protein [Oceanicella actignis]